MGAAAFRVMHERNAAKEAKAMPKAKPAKAKKK